VAPLDDKFSVLLLDGKGVYVKLALGGWNFPTTVRAQMFSAVQ
jgi:hypothetical protein